MGEEKRSLRARLQDFDAWAEGRRLRLLIGVVVFQSALAPALDRALGTIRDIRGVGGIARELGAVSFAGFQAISLASALVSLAAALLVVGGRASSLLSEPGIGGLWDALRELRLLVGTEWRLMKRKGAHDRALLVGLGLYATSVTLRDTMRLFRFLAWEGPIVTLGLEETSLARPFVWLYQMENALELGSMIAVIAAAWGLAIWVFRTPSLAQPSTMVSARAIDALSAELDLRSPGARKNVAAAFHGDLVGRALASLAAWRAAPDLSDERGVQLQLFEHLRGQGFDVGWEVHLGERRRVDLTVDDVIALELKFGGLRAGERDRLVGQSGDYARRWTGRGPLLVLCVGAAPERVRPAVESASAFNRGLSEHKGESAELPAPIFVLTRVGEEDES